MCNVLMRLWVSLGYIEKDLLVVVVILEKKILRILGFFMLLYLVGLVILKRLFLIIVW